MSVRDQKKKLRQEMQRRRGEQTLGAQWSRRIFKYLGGEPAFQESHSLACYVSFRSEVQTHEFLQSCLSVGKAVSVPLCHGNDLILYRIQSMDELMPSPFGILEPRPEIQNDERRVLPDTLDLMVMPGLAFSLDGGRLGYGRGYYDGLLGHQRQCLKVAVGFECQLVDRVPREAHDVRMDQLVTERQIYTIRQT